jgi:hypothetical protein
MMVAFDRRRKHLHAELNKIPGIKCLLAQGAFYLFPNVSSFGLKDLEFCDRLLDQEKVAAVPGSAFGAEGYIRLSYATSDETIRKRHHASCKVLRGPEALRAFTTGAGAFRGRSAPELIRLGLISVGAAKEPRLLDLSGRSTTLVATP